MIEETVDLVDPLVGIIRFPFAGQEAALLIEDTLDFVLPLIVD